jgi:hypothetical protein
LAKTEQNELWLNLKYNIDKKYYDCRCPIYKVCREFINRSHWYASAKY